MSVNLPFGESARSASILVVDDESDVADLFRQSFRREARQGTYVMHFAASGAEALHRLAGEIRPTLITVVTTSTCREWAAWSCWSRSSNGSPICRS